MLSEGRLAGLLFCHLLSKRIVSLLLLSPYSPPTSGLAATAEIREDHDNKMGDKPDIVVAHILIDVDQNKDPWSDNSEHHIKPVRHEISRIPALEKIREQRNPGKEE